MSYGKVKDSFWTDKKIRSFSDDARMLALYLMTGPHRNIIGCMRIPNGYIMEDLGWASKRLSDAMQMLIERKFICRDDDGWTLILNQLRHDPLSKNPKHVKAATTLADAVPRESRVFPALYSRLKANLDAIGMANEWQSDANGIPEPLPEPEPEPEPEPDRVTSPAATAPRSKSEINSAVDAYNASAERVGWPKAQQLNESRRRGLAARIAECGGADGFALAMLKAEQSDFLAGRSARGNGHENWTPDLDFFLKPKNFTKLMEGGYDNRTGVAGTELQAGLRALREHAAGSDRARQTVSEVRE